MKLFSPLAQGKHLPKAKQAVQGRDRASRHTGGGFHPHHHCKGEQSLPSRHMELIPDLGSLSSHVRSPWHY